MIAVFVWGWISGAIAVALCFLFDFEAVNQFLYLSNRLFMYLYAFIHGKKHTTRASTKTHATSILGSHAMSSISENGMEPVSQASPAAEKIGMPRLHTACQMLWMPPDYTEKGGVVEVAGALSDCRIVFSDTSLTVYNVFSSRNVSRNARVIAEEQFAGALSLDALSVRPVTLNVRRTAALGTSGGHGLHRHVLLITRRDGQPLFAEEPLEAANGETSSALSVAGARSQGSRRSKASHESAGQRRTRDEVSSSKGARTCLALRLHLARDVERWQSLLEGHSESIQWNSYVQHIPTADTFNILLSRVLFQSLRTTALANVLRKKIQHSLNRLRTEKFPREIEGQILIDECVLESQVPIISNVSTPILSPVGEMCFDMDFLYRGGCTLCFRFHLTYRGLRIPHVVFSVKIVHLSGRVRVSIGPPPSKKFWLGILTKPEVSLEVYQGLECGRGLLHRILTSLPDLSAIAANALKLYIYSDLALPSMDDFTLPSVTKTPPSSPVLRKSWNTRFDRRGAVARHKHKESSSEPEPTAPLPRKKSGASSVSLRHGEKDSLPEKKSNSTPNHKEEDGSLSRSQKEDFVTPLTVVDQMCLPRTSSSPATSAVSQGKASQRVSVLSVTEVGARSSHTEDSRRHSLRMRVQKILQPPVRTVSGSPKDNASQTQIVSQW